MRRLALTAATAACLLLPGCAATVSLAPAPDATSTGCAKVIVGLRTVQQVGAAQRRNTDAQGTAAWGTPASVTLYCGVQTPDASGLPCYTRDGVNWLRQTSKAGEVLTSYGRTPGVQVLITKPSSVSDAVEQLSAPVADGTRSVDKVCLSNSGADTTPATSTPPTPATTP